MDAISNCFNYKEGEERNFPTEIRTIIWDRAMSFERELQSWWKMKNFTYNPITHTVKAFVLTICNASIYVIHPFLALGINHKGTILYPLEQRAWARKIENRWQTVDPECCIV